MLPSLTMNDSMNLRLGYPKLFAYFSLGKTLGFQFADHQDVSLFNLVISVILPARISASIFFAHVLRVVFWTTQKQVCWIYTIPDVAMMANEHAVRNFSEMDLPREAMGVDCFSGYFEPTIAIGHHWPLPQPTVEQPIWRNVFPKPLVYWGWLTRICNAAIVTTDKSNRLSLDVAFSSICELGNRRRLATAALTKFWGFLLRGMLSHVDTFLSRFGQAWGVHCAARHFLLGLYSFILAQVSDSGNVLDAWGVAWIRRRADLLVEAAK